jgi:DNA-binding beta-propeller fold protein YncE
MDALHDDDPRQLGPYALLGRLGAGGMGQVYLGRTPDGRLAAVKAVHSAHAGDPRFRTRFAREIDTARRVRAPWTAAIIDADPDANRPWLASAYVPGPSLEQLVSGSGPLPEAVVGVLACRLADALAAVHAGGVVHRDLKPSNVLLAADGPWLVDFGIARAVDATRLTNTGMVVGTPAFMSPEQANGEDGDPPADVFSLGSTLVFAATGEGPFGTTGNPVAMLYRITDSEPQLDALPESLRGELAACLAKDPAARPTARELAIRFASWADRPDGWPPPGVPAPPAAPGAAAEPVLPGVLRPGTPRTRRKVTMIAGAVAVVLAATAGLVALLPRSDSPAGAEPVALPQAVGAPAPEPGPSGARPLANVQFGTDSRVAAENVAVRPDGTKAYLLNSDGVLVLDTAANAVTVKVNIPGYASSMSISKDGRRLGVVTHRSLVVIDTGTDQPIAMIDLGGGPGLSVPFGADSFNPNLGIDMPNLPGKTALNTDGRFAYVANTASDAVAVVDIDAGRIVDAIPTGSKPDGIAITPDGTRLLAGTLIGRERAVTVLDTASGSTVAEVALEKPMPIVLGSGPERGLEKIVVSPEGSRAYVLGTGEAIQVVDPRAATKLGELRVPGNLTDLAISPSGRYLYLPNRRDSAREVLVVDTANAFVVERIMVEQPAEAVAVNADGHRLYVTTSYLAEQQRNTLMVVDPGRRD